MVKALIRKTPSASRSNDGLGSLTPNPTGNLVGAQWGTHTKVVNPNHLTPRRRPPRAYSL